MGKLYSIYKINMYDMMRLNLRYTQLLEDRVFKLKSILPNGTEFIEYGQAVQSNFDQSMEVVITFEHPFFEDGHTVELTETEVVWKSLNSDLLERDRLITSVIYKNKYGKTPTFLLKES